MMAVQYYNGQLYDVIQPSIINQHPYMTPGYSKVPGVGGAAKLIGDYNSSNTQQPTRPQTPYTPNAFTQAQLAQFNNGQRGNFENNPAYQQYANKMQGMYGVSPVGAAGDVLNGQTAFNAGIGGKSAPTGGSNV